jgi:hypothetical protein
MVFILDPASLIGFGSLAFGGVSKLLGKSAQDKAAEANRRAAIRAFKERNKDIALLQAQEKRAQAVNVFDIERKARSAQAMAAVSAGEAGVTGQSVVEIVSDIERERGEALQRSEANLQDRMAMMEREKISGRTTMRSRIASVPRASTFGMIAGIGSDILGFASFAKEHQLFPGGDE